MEWKMGAAAAVLLVALAGLAYLPGQSDFFWILALYVPAFLGYLWICRHAGRVPLPALLGLALLLRLLLVPAMPQLSDDIYRFVWDGRLWLNGINPFEHTPTYYHGLATPPPGLDDALYECLNSPAYFTIYPPVAQAIFVFSCWLSPNSVYGSAVVMKAILFLSDVGMVAVLPALLRHLGLPPARSLWYLLNPLLIVESAGNLHFEGLMVFFLALSLWLLLQRKWAWSALSMSLSIATKLLPLLFLVFLIRRLGWRRSLLYFGGVGVLLLLLFAPLLSEAFLRGFGSSLDLYFRRFEFNGSIYYLLRWAGYQLAGYNAIAQIGPLLGLGTFIGIMGMAVWDGLRNPWPQRGQPEASSGGWAKRLAAGLAPLSLAAITLYLTLATTVHPWYLALPLFWCTFTPFRYPVLWSGLVVLTYANYMGAAYHEYLGLVALEYMAVAAFGWWELQTKKRYAKPS